MSCLHGLSGWDCYVCGPSDAAICKRYGKSFRRQDEAVGIAAPSNGTASAPVDERGSALFGGSNPPVLTKAEP